MGKQQHPSCSSSGATHGCWGLSTVQCARLDVDVLSTTAHNFGINPPESCNLPEKTIRPEVHEARNTSPRFPVGLRPLPVARACWR